VFVRGGEEMCVGGGSGNGKEYFISGNVKFGKYFLRPSRPHIMNSPIERNLLASTNIGNSQK
jgi:hypothetical protein